MPAIQAQDWIATSSLANGTYHYEFGGDASLCQGAQCTWDTALIGTITVWTTDYPEHRVTSNDVTAGRGIQQQPTSGYTAISPAGAATLGASPLVITIPGGVAGGVDIALGNLPQRRVKMIVTITTPGAFTRGWNGKD